MNYHCRIAPDLFASAVRAAVEEQAAAAASPQMRYRVLSEEQRSLTLCLWQGVRNSVCTRLVLDDGKGILTVTYFKQPSATVQGAAPEQVQSDGGTPDATAETASDPRSLGAFLAARATVCVVGAAAVWGIAWGISYALGNRNPALPLAVPAALAAVYTVGAIVRRAGVKRRFAAFLTDLLGVEAE